MAGQTINDRFLAAKHSIVGQGLAKAVCKATTEEMIGPKRKHLDYLVHCTNEPNISIPQMATLLIERSQHANWVVVYKSLITTHHLMCYGNERFTQYMASSNSTFQLGSFLDKSGVQGVLSGRAGYDMSPFIRRYSKYLNEKAIAYRTVAFDFCKVKRGKDDGAMRTMGTDRLLKTLPALQFQLDALLEFDCTANDLTNSVINVCFMLLFRDLIRLFACYNDAIINLLEKFFDMNKKQCRDALDLYKKFLIRMDNVSEFLKVAENVGIDKGDIPDLTKAPSSLLDALEQHLSSIEGKKPGSSTLATANAKNVKSGVSMLSSTSTAFGTAATHSDSNGFTDSNVIDSALRQRALAEEEAILNQFKAAKSPASTPVASTPSTVSINNAINNPFLTPTSEKSVDFFGAQQLPVQTKASDDLLQLNNPFSSAFEPQPQTPVTTLGNNILLQQQQSNIWLNNGFSSQQAFAQQNNNNLTAFVPDSAFSSVFGNAEQTVNSLSHSLQAAIISPDSVVATITNPFIYNDTEIPDEPSEAPDFIKSPEPDEDQSSEVPPPSDIEVDLPIEIDLNILEPSEEEASVDLPLPLCPKLVQQKPPRPPPPKKVYSKLAEVNEIVTQFEKPIETTPIQVPFPIPGNPYVISSPATQNMLGSHQTDFDSLANSLQSSTKISTPTANNNQAGILTGDLESSLASLAENLSINKSTIVQPKTVQWSSPKNKQPNWTPQPMAATNGSGYKPMGQGMATTPTSGLPASPYQPQIGIRPMPGLVQPLGVNIPINMSGFPQMTPQTTMTSPTGISPQIQAQQKSLLFH